MTNELIYLSNVFFSYGGHTVLENVNLEVKSGDFVGMIGPNGSGKTTIIKLILGLIKPDSGEVRLFGLSPDKRESRSKVGFVPQKATNFDNNFPATVKEVVGMGRIPKAGIFNKLGKKDKMQIEKALSEVDMLKYHNRLISELSVGQQQRVFIARALAAEPELLILDEPTVGVDHEAQKKFYGILKKLNNEGITIILVSHDVGVVSSYVNKIVCVNQSAVLHDISKGFQTQDFFCAYPEKMKIVSHNHSNCSKDRKGEC